MVALTERRQVPPVQTCTFNYKDVIKYTLLPRQGSKGLYFDADAFGGIAVATSTSRGERNQGEYRSSEVTYPSHLRHAPITEAVIDFRVQAPPKLDFAALEEAAERGFDYKREAVLTENTFGFSINAGAAQAQVAPANVKQVGVRLSSADQKYVALVRLEGFSLSRLAPYEDWVRLKTETARLWSIYVRQFTPVKITRVATRYINNLRLPMSQGQDFNVFLNTFGQLPPDLPQAVNSFGQRFSLHDPETQNSATVAVVWNRPVDVEGKVPIVLDIDAFTNREHDPNSDEVWKTLESLRALKNRCFFGSLTPEAWELYK